MKAILSKEEINKKVQILQKLSDRINDLWLKPYRAMVRDEELRLYYDHEVVLKMGTDFEVYDVVDGMDRIARVLAEMVENFL